MKLREIAAILGCTVEEIPGHREIQRIASFEDADEGCVTFLSDEKYRASAEKSSAAAVIVKKGMPIAGKINLEVDDPYAGYAKVALAFEDKTPLFDESIHPSACIDPSVSIHEKVSVGPGSVIGKRCSIGARTVIGARCVIENDTVIGSDCRIDSGAVIRRQTHIADRVIIQSGAVVGSEGFGNAVENGAFVRIPCFGNVVIEDDVEIGANVTIDRGNFKPTIIRKGARIDNLVQIAHNVEIGEHTAIAAQAGISGSTTIGHHVMIGGQAGFVGHIEVGNGTLVGAKAGVSKTVPPGKKVTGYPARDFMTMRRIEAAQAQIPAMLKEVKNLRKEIEILKKSKEQ